MLSQSIQEILFLDLVLFLSFVYLVSEYRLYFLIVTFVSISILSKHLTSQLISLSETKKKSFFRNELIYILFRRFYKKTSLEDELQKMVSTSRKFGVDQTSELNVSLEIHLFMKKFSANLIEKWFVPYVSKNERFPIEAQSQLELLFTDLFYLFARIDKLEFCSQIAYLFNKKFYNISIEYIKSGYLSTENLHPAVRNGTISEIAYMRRFVTIVLRKSATNLNLDNPFVEDFLADLIGKNCIEKLINLISKPNFIYYSICLLCDKVETQANFRQESKKNKSESKQTELEVNRSKIEIPTDETNFLAFEAKISKIDNFVSPKSDFKDTRTFSSSTQRSFVDENNLYQEFNEKNLLAFKLSTSSSEFNSDVEIIRLEIDSTETSYELHNSKQYTSYNIKIEYRENILNDSQPKFNSTILVKNFKRRYKEFVLLQKKLEEYPIYKSLLRNIKGPASKLLNIPIGNMDQDLVDKRKKKLNDYLNKIIKIPQIFKSKEMCLFLGNCNIKIYPRMDQRARTLTSENLLLKKFGGVIDRLSPFSKTNEDIILDASIEMNNYSYEYNNRTSYDKFNMILLDEINKINQIKHENKHDEYSNVFKINKVEDREEIHFSKSILEILNKSIIASSIIGDQNTEKCWINNSKFYKTIEASLFDFYLERFFEDFFNEILSEKKLIEYIHDIEGILFDSSDQDEDKSIFDVDEVKFIMFTQKILHNLLPSIAAKLIGEDRFKGGVNILIDSLRTQLLNKHFVYCFLDLILLSIYKEDLSDIF